jgi:hypothetical protein
MFVKILGIRIAPGGWQMPGGVEDYDVGRLEARGQPFGRDD